MKKVMVIPVLIGLLGAISDRFKNHIEPIRIKIGLNVIQKMALLGTTRILRKVLYL